jgi:cell division septum initiation protein DivIVA
MTEVREAALAPVRAYLLDTARREASRILETARAEAEVVIGQARRAAEEAVAAATSDGQATGASLGIEERNQGRSQARSIVLAARRAAEVRLREQVMAAVARLPEEAGYADLVARLSRLATDAAGPGATVTSSPAGGVVARSGQVVVDCSLPRLADQAIDALGGRVKELWGP